MLKKNLSIYSQLLATLPLAELAHLYSRSSDYKPLNAAIEAEIDNRLSVCAKVCEQSLMVEDEVRQNNQLQTV